MGVPHIVIIGLGEQVSDVAFILVAEFDTIVLGDHVEQRELLVWGLVIYVKIKFFYGD